MIKTWRQPRNWLKKNSRITKIALIFDKDVIEGLKGHKLKDQLDAFSFAKACLPELLKDVRVVADKKKAIHNAIDKFENGSWIPVGLEGGETGSSSQVQAEGGDGETQEE